MSVHRFSIPIRPHIPIFNKKQYSDNLNHHSDDSNISFNHSYISSSFCQTSSCHDSLFSSNTISQYIIFPPDIHSQKQYSILTLASDQVLTQSPPSNHKPLLQYPVSYPPIDLNELATLSVLHSNISSTSPDDQGEIDCYS